MAIHLSLVSCLSSSSPPYSSCIQPNTPHSSFSLPLSLASLLDRSFHAALLMISLPRASLRLDRELLVALLLPRHPRHSLLPTRRHDSSTLHSSLSHTPRPRVNQRRFALRGRRLRLRLRLTLSQSTQTVPHVLCRMRYAISAAAAVRGDGLTSAIEEGPLAVRGWEFEAGSLCSGSTTMSTLSVGGEAKETGLGVGLRVVLRSVW